MWNSAALTGGITASVMQIKRLYQEDFIPDDKATGKMQHDLVIFGLLFSSGEDPAMGFEVLVLLAS